MLFKRRSGSYCDDLSPPFWSPDVTLIGVSITPGLPSEGDRDGPIVHSWYHIPSHSGLSGEWACGQISACAVKY